VIYAKAFFDLQLQFAHKVTVLSGLPLARILLEYTNLYIRFGVGRDFDPAHPAWREYLAGLHDPDDIAEWTYSFYLKRSDAMAGPTVAVTFGCFSYAWPSDDRIRLHFQNAETDGHSALAIDRVNQRMTELAALFEHVKRTSRRPLQVVGTSWLYNIDAYRRLFPLSYVASAQAIADRFQHMPLWGQFLDRHGTIRENVSRQFLERLERQASLEGLARCFPFQALSVDAPVRDFYDFYGI
jgi:hypothetical protein